jgi:hypothetical protein
MIEDSKKSFYHGCAAQYMRLFVMVKLLHLKMSNRWSDGSFKDLFLFNLDVGCLSNALLCIVSSKK